MMSCSDPKHHCRKFVELNVGARATHWFTTMEEQIQGSACALHPTAVGGCQGAPMEADLAIAGTPCHPFSTQLAGRCSVGKVENHKEFQVAMELFLRWMVTFEPACTIFEQVPGFDKPIQAGGAETPLDRPLGAAHVSEFATCPGLGKGLGLGEVAIARAVGIVTSSCAEVSSEVQNRARSHETCRLMDSIKQTKFRGGYFLAKVTVDMRHWVAIARERTGERWMWRSLLFVVVVFGSWLCALFGTLSQNNIFGFIVVLKRCDQTPAQQPDDGVLQRPDSCDRY